VLYQSRRKRAHYTFARNARKIGTRTTNSHLSIFYNGNEEPPAEKIVEKENGWGELGRDARTFGRFRRLFKEMERGDIMLLIFMAQKLSRKKKLPSANPKARS
jgi:hypothetical protein